MTHLQETLINRPYGTGRVFFLFSRHFVPGYPRFNRSGIMGKGTSPPLR